MSHLSIRCILGGLLSVALLASQAFLPASALADALVDKTEMDRYSGNLEVWVQPQLLIEIVAIGAVSYLAVAALHIHRIRQVGLAEALKVQE